MLILAKSSYLQQQFRAKQIRADLTQEKIENNAKQD